MPHTYSHEALPYAGRPAFASVCADLVTDGLERDERLIVLAHQTKLDDLRGLLGRAADEVAFVATDDHGRNPSRITTMLHSFQALGDGRHALGVTETVVRGRRRAARAEAELSDALLNEPALQDWPIALVCLYDTQELDADQLAAMRCSHPAIRGEVANPAYVPDLARTLYGRALDASPLHAVRLTVHNRQLTEMRAFVRAAAAGFGVGADRIDDLVLSANEIVTNSFRYGGGRAVVGMWVDDGAVVCEVVDHGHLADPLTGRFAPPPSAGSGRGLWLAHHLCDLMQVRSSATGTTVRMHVDC